MEIRTNSFYSWMIVLIINLVVVYFIVIVNNYGDFYSLFELESILMLAISIFVTVVPVLISKPSYETKISKNRHYIGYGIPLFLIILATYLWFFLPCTETKGAFISCDFIGQIYGAIIGIIAVIFIIFYSIMIIFRKTKDTQKDSTISN
jgi:hypothetical protein